MPRYAFKLRIKADAIEEYDRSHQNVWPELLAKIKEAGISRHSIFRRGQELFLFMHVDDFDRAWDELAKEPVNQRWQKEMSRLFEPVPDQQPGERFALMKEVFYLEVEGDRRLDITRGIAPPVEKKIIRRDDGFVWKLESWTTWLIDRPFNDVPGLLEYIFRKIEETYRTGGAALSARDRDGIKGRSILAAGAPKFSMIHDRKMVRRQSNR